MNDWLKIFQRTRLYKQVYKWWRTFTFIGLEGVPFYDVMAFLFKEMRRDSISTRAASVAFNFILATFPGIIFMFTLIAYIPINGLTNTLLHSIKEVMPDNTFTVIQATIIDILKRHRGGLLSFGLILALFYSLSGVRSLMNAFNKNYPNFRRRSLPNKYWVSFKITCLLIASLLVSVSLIVLGKYVIHLIITWFHVRYKTGRLLINIINWLFIILCFYVSISLIYYYGHPSRSKWRFWNIGSTMATILNIITSLCFSYFVKVVGNYNAVYGSIGTLMVVMLWYYFNAYSLLIGFELNASIDYNKNMPKLIPNSDMKTPKPRVKKEGQS